MSSLFTVTLPLHVTTPNAVNIDKEFKFISTSRRSKLSRTLTVTSTMNQALTILIVEIVSKGTLPISR